MYEGDPLHHVIFPSLLVAALNISNLILTNAAGGLNAEYSVGDLMIIDEGINLMYRPLEMAAFPEPAALRRVDRARIFSPEWREKVSAHAAVRGILLRRGVYISTLGPSYETPAEIRYFRYMGGDAVGMSTVPEATAAAALGVNVLGISFITNLISEIPLKQTTHEEVIAASEKAGPRLAELIKIIITEVPPHALYDEKD